MTQKKNSNDYYPFTIFSDLLDNPQSRGTFGEMIVKSIFDPRFFGNEEHYLVNDIILGTPDGKTHQIDRVFIYTKMFAVDKINLTNVKPLLISIGWREEFGDERGS